MKMNLKVKKILSIVNKYDIFISEVLQITKILSILSVFTCECSRILSWAKGAGSRRGVQKEKLYDMHCPPRIIRAINSIVMRWAGHVERMGTGKTYAKF
jgi:hypothetical protein